MFDNELQKIALYVFGQNGQSTDDLLKFCAEDYLLRRGENTTVVGVYRNDKGAPSLVGDGMPFVSASHSGQFVVCAVSDGRVGVDLQEIRRFRGETADDQAKRLLHLAKRFFHPGDASWVKSDPFGRFFTVWSAKESYVKYTGDGIDDAFASARAIPDGGPYGSEWECDGVYYYSLPFDENYSFCVCCGYPAEIETTFVDSF